MLNENIMPLFVAQRQLQRLRDGGRTEDGETDGDDDPGAFLNLLVAAAAFTLLILGALLAKDQHNRSYRVMNATAAVDGDDDDDDERSPMSKLSPKQRKEFISASLETKVSRARRTMDDSALKKFSHLHHTSTCTIKSHSSCAPCRDGSTADTSDGPEPSTNDVDDFDHHCAICLTNYEEGEEMCGSPNEACNHFYHRECITGWLRKKEDCPCCRRTFLPQATTTTTATSDRVDEGQENDKSDIEMGISDTERV